jgi:serine/threonine protein phosphatase PrpC
VTVLRSGSATDIGRVRKINQDLPLEGMNLYAVADGMGGHVGGEVAAQVAVEALNRAFSREPTRDGLENAFSTANTAVWQESQDNSELRGMGTTLTAVALVGGKDGRDTLALANVGDSRAYLYSDGQIVQVTADHSLAEERVRHGEMTEEEAAVHPQRHILTRVLGVASEVETDMWELQLRAGDRLVLCSDGLSNEITPEEMVDVLATVPDPGDAARQLVDVANEHGGADNITVVVVDVLVGEDTPAGASVIIPIGARAGGPLLVGHEASPTATVETLAPGSSEAFIEGTQLGFGSRTSSLNGEPRSGEFFPDTTQAVPVARSTDRSTASMMSSAAAVPHDETRRQRRRRLGIQRRVTLRVILFVLLVAAIPTAAYFAIRWYAYDNWIVSVKKGEIIVQQGRQGGVLWFHPRVVDHTHVLTSQLLPNDVAQIRGGVQEPSLMAAKHYVTNLHNQYVSVQQQKIAKTTTTTTTTTPGAPATTIPGSPTTTTPVTTVPPATTATTVAPTAAPAVSPTTPATSSTVATTATTAAAVGPGPALRP